MSWFIIVFFIISVILFLITKYYLSKIEYYNKKRNDKLEAFETELNTTSADKLKLDHNITINYLDIITAQKLVKKNGEYLQGMNQANLSARNCVTIDDLYIKYKNGFQEITSTEKDNIDIFILNLVNDIKRFNNPYYRYVCYWLNKISIAKAQSWLEEGMPHTLEHTIIFDSPWFVNPRKQTLLHELTHIHQREVDFDFEDLYKELGYYYYPEYIKGMEDIYPLNRNNPDGLSTFWLWKMPKVSAENINSKTINSLDTINSNNINNYWWIGAIFKTITPTSLNDINLVALKLDNDSDGHFYYLKQQPTLLSTWKPFVTFFGENPNNYHPNEMTAKFAEFFLLDILNDKHRTFDNYEGYKIYKKYFENMINKYY